MTIAELIVALQAYPSDMLVMTRGYEGGYCDAKPEGVKNLVLNMNTAWGYGPHDTKSDDDDCRVTVPALIL